MCLVYSFLIASWKACSKEQMLSGRLLSRTFRTGMVEQLCRLHNSCDAALRWVEAEARQRTGTLVVFLDTVVVQ